jgi:hypothetical protein
MSERKKVYRKDLSYATVFADGVILRIDEDSICRIIFYQKGIEPNEDETSIDRTKDVIQLKFEVRVPQGVLERLFNFGAKLIKLEDDAYEVTENKDDPKLNEVYWRLRDKVDNFVYDTSSTYSASNKEILELQDEYAELIGRAQRAPSTNKDEQK